VRVLARGGGDPRGGRLWLPVAVGLVAALVAGLLIGRITAPNDERPPDRGATRAPSPGPTREQAAVPVGYARTSDGAAAALLNYSVVLSRLLLEPPDRRSAALDVLASPEFATDTTRQLQRARAAAEAGPLGTALRGEGTAVYRGGPLGFRVVRFSRDEAVVDTWAFGIAAADPGLDPQMTFQTATSTLVWRNGDWKLAASRSRPGPTPRVTGPKVSGRAFVDGAGRLRELRYAP